MMVCATYTYRVTKELGRRCAFGFRLALLKITNEKEVGQIGVPGGPGGPIGRMRLTINVQPPGRALAVALSS